MIFLAVYFDTTNDCHDLNFNFGQNAIGTAIPTRMFTIKVCCNELGLGKYLGNYVISFGRSVKYHALTL